MQDPKIVGIILIIGGGILVFKTSWFIRFQIWTQKIILGADYIPSARTYKMMRIFGVIIMTMGLFVTFFA